MPRSTQRRASGLAMARARRSAASTSGRLRAIGAPLRRAYICSRRCRSRRQIMPAAATAPAPTMAASPGLPWWRALPWCGRPLLSDDVTGRCGGPEVPAVVAGREPAAASGTLTLPGSVAPRAPTVDGGPGGTAVAPVSAGGPAVAGRLASEPPGGLGLEPPRGEEASPAAPALGPPGASSGPALRAV